MARSVFAGAQERLQEIAPQVTLEVRGELKDKAELGGAINDFEAAGKDGMIILRSGGVVYLANNPPNIPTFIGGNNHPVMLGAVDSMDSPSGNITGVTYFVDLSYPLERFIAMDTSIESFLLLSETGHPSSAIDGQGTMESCAEMQITCKQVFVASEEEIPEIVAREMVDFDAAVLGNQAVLFDNAGKVLEAADGKPVFSFSENGVNGGALAGIVTSNQHLGSMLADSLVEVLIEGRPISEVGIKTDTRPILSVNFETAAKFRTDFRLFE